MNGADIFGGFSELPMLLTDGYLVTFLEGGRK